MEKNNLHILLEFLNDLASQLAEKGKEHNQEIVRSVFEATEYLKEDLTEAIKKGKDYDKDGIIKMPPITKITLPEKFNFTKIEMPSRLSLEEAGDIIEVLQKIVSEVQKKDLKVDFSKTEKRLENIYNLISEKIDREDAREERKQKAIAGKLDEIKKAIPKTELPMEKGRIKVILPDEQVMRTPLGEKVSKAIRGVFMGGETINPRLAQLPDSLTQEGNLKVAVLEGGGAAQTQVKDSLGVWRDVGYETGNLNKPVEIRTALPAGTNIVGRMGHDITAISDGRQTVATAGTRVALASSTPCRKVDIQASVNNLGVIVVGSSTVVATLATRRGITLFAGDFYSLEIDNLNKIFIDSDVSGSSVTFNVYA